MRWILAILALASFAFPASAQAQQQQFATFHTCKLASGRAIQNCRIGYRTFGKLNADKSNVVLFPMWYAGRSADAEIYVGPGKLLDTSKYYVIIVDPLGNGVSSSPSNSTTQPEARFPAFTIRDMVNQEHRLLTESLHITHVHAVMGISMGGMQTLEWAVSYPEFSDRFISIVGSPQLSGYGQILWRTMKAAMQADAAWQHGGCTAAPPSSSIPAGLFIMLLQTPGRISGTIPPGKAAATLAQWGKLLAADDPYNWIDQTDAMLVLNIYPQFHALSNANLRRVKENTLLIVSAQDHAVDPSPGIAFAKLLQHPAVVINSPCGHTLTVCSAETRIVSTVRNFLGDTAASMPKAASSVKQ